MKKACCGCLAAIPLALLFFLGGFVILAHISSESIDYSGPTPAEEVIYSSQGGPSADSGSSQAVSNQPWGYSSRLYLVLSQRVGDSFPKWIDTISRDVVTYWSKYSQANLTLYGGKIINPANLDVRRMVNRTINCANELQSGNSGFYCGGEDFVALDFDEYESYSNRFGPIVLMFGLGHEWGHAQQRYMTFDHNQMAEMDREKQADCFMGTYMYSRYSKAPNVFLTYSINGENHPPIGDTDLDGLQAFLEYARGKYDRYSWFLEGFNNGIDACLALAP